jgi:RHS repeat-associated protein
MMMPGRKYDEGTGYRYGFNGKENDNEVKGKGLQLDYGFRIYDPRMGRFLSVDPLVNKYPMLTPYQFASNMPTIAVDIDGEEAKIKILYHSLFNPNTVFNTVYTSQLWLVDDKKSQGEIFSQSLFNPQGHWEVHKYPTVTSKGIQYKDFGNAFFVPEGVNFQTGRIDIGASPQLFSEAIKIVLKNEGGWKNEPQKDKGDPTNRGISWPIWQANAKNTLGVEPTLENLKNLSVSQATKIYYEVYWKPRGFDKIRDADVAVQIYDWTITSGGAVKEIQRLLNKEFGKDIKETGVLNQSTIDAINGVDQTKLYNRVREVRKDYYDKGADEGWFSEDYRDGLKGRADKFKKKG